MFGLFIVKAYTDLQRIDYGRPVRALMALLSRTQRTLLLDHRADGDRQRQFDEQNDIGALVMAQSYAPYLFLRRRQGIAHRSFALLINR